MARRTRKTMKTMLPTAREPDVFGHCGPRSRTPILRPSGDEVNSAEYQIRYAPTLLCRHIMNLRLIIKGRIQPMGELPHRQNAATSRLSLHPPSPSRLAPPCSLPSPSFPTLQTGYMRTHQASSRSASSGRYPQQTRTPSSTPCGPQDGYVDDTQRLAVGERRSVIPRRDTWGQIVAEEVSL